MQMDRDHVQAYRKTERLADRQIDMKTDGHAEKIDRHILADRQTCRLTYMQARQDCHADRLTEIADGQAYMQCRQTVMKKDRHA